MVENAVIVARGNPASIVLEVPFTRVLRIDQTIKGTGGRCRSNISRVTRTRGIIRGGIILS